MKKNNRGQAIIEFALVLPILVTLLMGMLEFGLFFHSHINITFASKEAARIAAMRHKTLRIIEFHLRSLSSAIFGILCGIAGRRGESYDRGRCPRHPCQRDIVPLESHTGDGKKTAVIHHMAVLLYFPVPGAKAPE